MVNPAAQTGQTLRPAFIIGLLSASECDVCRFIGGKTKGAAAAAAGGELLAEWLKPAC